MSNMLQAAQQVLKLAMQNQDKGSMVNTPWRDAAINAIQTGDAQNGQALAENIIKSYGFSSPQEALQSFVQNRVKR